MKYLPFYKYLFHFIESSYANLGKNRSLFEFFMTLLIENFVPCLRVVGLALPLVRIRIR